MLPKPMTDKETAIRTLRFVVGFLLVLAGLLVVLPILIHFTSEGIIPGLAAIVVMLTGARCLKGLAWK